MGKSKCSCFRILYCTEGDSASGDELLPQECQASSYKCPWSFRKRLPSNRVLRRDAVSGPQSVIYNKVNLEAVSNSSSAANNFYISEQASFHMRPSKEELSVGSALSPVAVNTEVSAIVTPNAINNNENFQESAVIVIQAAIRGHLTMRKLKKVKNVIKLQAAVRGHLVRLQAVGTLRCILAISKMQAIVRNHLASRPQENLVDGKGYHCKGRFYSAKRLLANRFAQQLLASTENTRTIHIKCEPLSSDSAWLWLERWMTIITEDNGEKKEQNLSYADKEVVKSSKLLSNEEKKDGSADSKSDTRALTLSLESKNDLSSSSKSNLQSKLDDHVSDSCSNSIEKDEQIQKTNDNSSYKTDPKGNNVSITTEREHAGPLEIEAQKVAMWSRRPWNPAFSAAQSKFKELSAISKNVRCTSSFNSNEDCAADARIDNKHSHVKKGKVSGFSEKLPSHYSIIQVASSECGTEISISSTLDSPDRSEMECGEIILEIGSMDNNNYSVTASSNNDFRLTNKCNESRTSQINKVDEMVNPSDSSLITTTETQSQLETTNFQHDKSSIEGTPRSQIAALGPYGTPSSELSVNAESAYGDGNMATGSGKSLVPRGMRRSVTKASTDHLSNESTNEKRRRSAITRIDLDDEPRMSNSYSNSNSLPSYMQATKSAKAKVHASISPKSSPDLHDKDDLAKKRHSLPIGNGKQDTSPPKKRTTPRVQQNPKGNDVHNSHTSTERRWLR